MDALVSVANVLYLLSYSTRDLLRLRILTVVAAGHPGDLLLDAARALGRGDRLEFVLHRTQSFSYRAAAFNAAVRGTNKYGEGKTTMITTATLVRFIEFHGLPSPVVRGNGDLVVFSYATEIENGEVRTVEVAETIAATPGAVRAWLGYQRR